MRIKRYSVSSAERSSIKALVQQLPLLSADMDFPLLPWNDVAYNMIADTGNRFYHRINFSNANDHIDILTNLIESIGSVGPKRHQDGLVVLQNVPTEIKAAGITTLLAALSGVIIQYSGHGAPIIKVSDKSRDHIQVRPSSDNALGFGLHTDMAFVKIPPPIVFLTMVETASVGGVSLFCDLFDVIHRLSPNDREALSSKYEFPPPPHQPGGADQYFSILERYQSDHIEVRYRGDGLKPGNVAQLDAFENFKSKVNGSFEEIELHSGDVAIICNRSMLHGRTAYADDTRQRSVMRCYAKLHSRCTPDDRALICSNQES